MTRLREVEPVTRVDSLRAELEEATGRILAGAGRLSGADWHTVCEEDGRTAGQIIGHIADVFGVIHLIVGGIDSGTSYPKLTPEWVESRNAEGAEMASSVPRAEVVERLRVCAKSVGDLLGRLSDERLDMTGEVFGNSLTIENILRLVLIGHVLGHLREVENSIVP